MYGKMKVALMTAPGMMEIVERDIPSVKENEVLVELEYVGICGSDLHYFETGRLGDFVVEYPFVLGHEAGGIVVELGSAVTNLAIGDRVALEPGKTCGQCSFCKEGKYNLCSHVVFFAAPPDDGVFQEYVAHEATLCFKLPENVSAKEGALIEPLAVGFHAAVQGCATLGQTAVVTGSGCIGLVSLMALKAMGVTNVYVVDVIQKRLDRAMELGATQVINAKNEDPVAAVMRYTKNEGCDLAIETAGTDATTQNVIKMAKKGGTVVLVGYTPSGIVPIPVGMALDKELTIKTVFRYRNMYPKAIHAVADGKVNLKGLASHEFALDDIQNAMLQSSQNKTDIVKAVVRIR